MQLPASIFEYMSHHSTELGERILRDFPALHRVGDILSPRIADLRRKPFPAQNVAIMGIAKRWETWRTAAIIGEMGTGKTLMAFGAIDVHSNGGRYNALAMVPPHLVEKTAREAFQTLRRIRVFLIDDLRNGGDLAAPHGINEVKLRKGEIVREGLHTSLTDLRRKKDYYNSRKRWESICPEPCLFIVSRERMKLGYFWRDAYFVAKSGQYRSCVVNPDTGLPVMTDDERLIETDFGEEKKAELFDSIGGHPCRGRHSPLWQADGSKIQRVAPIDFMKRYMRGFFDYAVADEVHQLFGDTAQGNALGGLVSCVDRIVGLTGTLMGGYAGDLFNFLYRFEAAKMKEKGYEWGPSGRSDFVQRYGVVEEITNIPPEDNACSDAKPTCSVRERPGASPLLFADFLMDLCAFVNLEDISEALPPYEETVVNIPMDEILENAYSDLEEDMVAALKANRKNRSVLSKMLNSLLLYPDHPFDIGEIYGTKPILGTKRKTAFLITRTKDLPKDRLYAKEQRLLEGIKQELALGRRCQVYAVYTQKHDVTARLEQVLTQAGIRVAVLKSKIPTDKREAWYRRKLKQGVQVVICHPKLVETGLDLLEFPTIIFYQSGYSLHTLRQASRRSWRIGQHLPVRVKFFCYERTMQTKCLQLMGKKLLTALMLEGKFYGDGLQDIDGAEDSDMLAAMARTLTEEGIGESADEVWKTLNQEHQRMFISTPAAQADHDILSMPVTDIPASPEELLAETEPVVVTISDAERLMQSALGPESASVLVFGQRPESLRSSRKRSRTPAADQPSLFNWN
jgi:superfamily II DNA or RNA helicase